MPFPASGSMASTACGTARVRASTAPATRLHCANMAGTHKHGGILAIAGDDHGAHSSTYPHQTEYVFQNCFIPVLNPASVQDVIDLGLAGWAMSRFAGVWVAMKTTAETMEQASTAIVPSARRFVTPDIALPPHGLNFDHTLHFPADRAELERRMIEERMPALLAWARANRIDRLISGGPDATIGLITVGKAHEDTMHALRRLGLRRASATRGLQGRHDLAAGNRGS